MGTEMPGIRLSKMTRSEADAMPQGNSQVHNTVILQLLCVKTPQLWHERKKGRGHLERTQGPLEGVGCTTDPLPLAKTETVVDSGMRAQALHYSGTPTVSGSASP